MGWAQSKSFCPAYETAQVVGGLQTVHIALQRQSCLDTSQGFRRCQQGAYSVLVGLCVQVCGWHECGPHGGICSVTLHCSEVHLMVLPIMVTIHAVTLICLCSVLNLVPSHFNLHMVLLLLF